MSCLLPPFPVSPRPATLPRKRNRPKRGRMVSRGETTEHPSVYKVDGGYLVKSTARVGTRRLYRERLVKGTIADALIAQRQLRIDLESEVEEIRAPKAPVANPGQDTFGTWVEKWIAYKQTEDLAASTITCYREKLKSHISPYWKDVRVADINPLKVDDWLMWLSKEQAKTYSKETLRGAWRVFCVAIRWISKQCGQGSPVEQATFKARGKAAKEKSGLTLEETQALLGSLHVVREPYATGIALMAMTGCRVGEVCALRWQDIDETRRMIFIRRAVSKGVIRETPKSKENRAALYGEAVAGLLASLKASGAGKDGQPILWSAWDTPLRPSGFRVPLATLCKAAGLTRKVSPHDFRRTANDEMRTHAGEVATRKVLGHTPAMTINYATVRVDELERAQGRLLGLTVGTVGKGKVVGRAVGIRKENLASSSTTSAETSS